MLDLQDTSAPHAPAAGILGRLERLAASRAFAYVSILLLQLKMVWGIWNLKDLTPDDTAYYFTAAHDWYMKLQTLFTWSPLYTAFYASFLHVSADAYFATIAHRLVIVAVLAVLVLFTMRRFLPPGIAWLMAAWWVLLPINFDTRYEVHLFSVVPLLATVLLTTWKSTWSLPAALATLLGTTILLRNEYAIAVLLFAAILLRYEIGRLRGTSIYEKRRTSARYAVCIFAVLLISAFFLFRATDQFRLARMAKDKHSLNWCQVYAYGYQQRHSDFTGSPWSDCHDLMHRTFGGTQPSFIESVIHNPAAVIGHFAWNLRLLPDGLDLLLFNVAAGPTTPDYGPVPVNRFVALSFGIALIAILVTATALVRRNKSALRAMLGDQSWAWTLIGCMTVVALITMITQRPRPSYLLTFGIFIRILAGVAIWILLRRWAFPPLTRSLLPIVAAILLVFVPPYYKPDPHDRPLLTAYRRLHAFEQQLQSRPARLVARGWTEELCNYVVAGATSCAPFTYSDIAAQGDTLGGLNNALDAREINTLYVDGGIYPDARLQQLIAGAPANGWQVIGSGQIRDNRWALLYRAAMPQTIPEIVQPGSGVFVGRKWYPYEQYQGIAFRWVNNDADIDIDPAVPVSKLKIDLQPGPAMQGRKLHLDIRDPDGATLAQFTVERRQTIEVKLDPSAAYNYVRLHTEDAGRPTPADPRVLNFRVFRISTTAAPAAVQTNAPAATAADIVAPGTGVRIASGWYPYEVYGGQQFRWINNDAEFLVDAGQGSIHLAFEVQPGPGAAGKPLHVRFINDANATVASADVSHMATVDVQLPASPASATHYRIHIDGGGAAVPNDPRILNLRMFRVRRAGP